MKKNLFCWLLLLPLYSICQVGIKAGLNYANVSSASSINSSSRSGFHAGLFLAPASKKIISSRTELLFSRQGYDYKTSTNTGNVNLDYLLQTQLMCINITKFVQLQFGAQTAILVSAKVDSSNGTGGSSANKIMDLYNRFDYGYALGAEIHPVSGLTIGARYNVSLGKVYKDLQSMEKPSFTSEDAKNNVVQLFIGWRFGKQPSSKKKEQSQ
jgi:hypothetical protein